MRCWKTILWTIYSMCFSVESIAGDIEFNRSWESLQASRLDSVENLLRSYKNDSAAILLTKVDAELYSKNLQNKAINGRILLYKGILADQKDQADSARLYLFDAIASARKFKKHKEYAKGSLVMSLLYEKLLFYEFSESYLDSADLVIKRHQLYELEPYFWIRKASLLRVMGKDEEALQWTKKALETSKNAKLEFEEANAHMLMVLLLPKSEREQRLESCLKAISLYKSLQDDTGTGYMYANLARLFNESNEFRKGITAADSAIFYANKSVQLGFPRNPTVPSMYLMKGNFLSKLGESELSWTYKEKGYKAMLEQERENFKLKVTQIDTRAAIEQHLKELKFERERVELQQLLLIIVIVVLALLVGLISVLLKFYRREKNHTLLLEEKNFLITNQSEKLKKNEASKRLFIQNVSHEIRTPLTVLFGPIDLIRQADNITARQRELLSIMDRSRVELLEMVTSILDIDRLDAGVLSLNELSIELEGFLRNFLLPYELDASIKNIKFSTDLSSLKGVECTVDIDKLKRILSNLVSNALKFTPRYGSISIQGGILNKEFYIRVEDSGIGISPSELPFVFQRFFQSKRKTSHNVGGTGIGLSIAYEYTKLMNGSLSVTSELNKGSVFSLKLPLKKSIDFLKPIDSVNLSNTASIVTGNKKHGVLIVEDNFQLAAFIKTLLEPYYITWTVNNGEEALTFLEESGCNVSLILSDLMMPFMDGISLVKTLKDSDTFASIPFVLMTAKTDNATKMEALRIGMDDFISKPFNGTELLVRIHNLLENVAKREIFQEDEVTSELEKEVKTSRITKSDLEWLERFENYVIQHFRSELLTIPALAEEFAMSESTLLRQLKKVCGLSPIQYIQEVRLSRARELLEKGEVVKVEQLTHNVGYRDVRTFSRAFKKRFGKSPNKWFEEEDYSNN